MDELKGFVIICVVLGHVLDGYIASAYWPEQNNVLTMLFNLIYSYHMPLCFILSGYFYYLAYFTKDGELRDKKLNLHVADFISVYIFFSIIFWISKLLMSGNVNSNVLVTDILWIWNKPLPSFWYLYVLIAFYCIFKFNWWSKVSPIWMLVFLFVASIISDFMTWSYGFEIKRIIFYAFFFYIGICIKKSKQFILFQRQILFLIGSLAIALCTVFSIRGVQINKVPFVNVVVALGISILLWKLFEKLWDNQSDEKIGLHLLGENMLEIYVTHILLTAAIRIVLHKIKIEIPILCILLNTLLSICIPTMCSIIMKKIGIHDFIFRPFSFHFDKTKKLIDNKERI
ncbi:MULTISPECIES: acyltransferase family protein [Lachnospiraceae]|uniref:acyltransferase family protein n=1 Tax=Lachnospiraceae TaxID=186803 RepID=UPI000462C784|nr:MULTISPECIES: acyltransferase family protein [Lachnospiraceae]